MNTCLAHKPHCLHWHSCPPTLTDTCTQALQDAFQETVSLQRTTLSILLTSLLRKTKRSIKKVAERIPEWKQVLGRLLTKWQISPGASVWSCTHQLISAKNVFLCHHVMPHHPSDHNTRLPDPEASHSSSPFVFLSVHPYLEPKSLLSEAITTWFLLSCAVIWEKWHQMRKLYYINLPWGRKFQKQQLRYKSKLILENRPEEHQISQFKRLEVLGNSRTIIAKSLWNYHLFRLCINFSGTIS